MTLEEAIKHEEKLMMKNLEKTKDRNASDPIAINSFECADKHRQLAEWLKDYKRLLGAIDNIKSDVEKVGYAKDEYGSIRADVLRVWQVLDIIEKHTSGGAE